MFYLISFIWEIYFIKTVIVKLKYFPLKVAIMYPVIIDNRTILKSINGRVDLNVKPKFGLIRFGA
jgi:hypothetical protein